MSRHPKPLKFLGPQWFAVVMGWAGLGLAWHRAAPEFGDGAHAVALGCAVVAASVFAVLAAGSLLRLARDHVSLDAPIEADGDTALGDLLAREMSPGPDEMVLDAEDRARLDDMLSSLDERSADVVRRRYGLMDGRQAKLADIAAVWGITAERVRQIERHAIAKLRSSQELAA